MPGIKEELLWPRKQRIVQNTIQSYLYLCLTVTAEMNHKNNSLVTWSKKKWHSSLNKYLLNSFFVSDVFLGARDTGINQSFITHEEHQGRRLLLLVTKHKHHILNKMSDYRCYTKKQVKMRGKKLKRSSVLHRVGRGAFSISNLWAEMWIKWVKERKT